MWNLLQNDVRLSLRILLRNPAFACAAIVILALGIGANATVFSFVDSVLLEPLDYPDASRLVQVWEYNSSTRERTWVYYGNFLDWKNRNRTFDQLALYNVFDSTIWWNTVVGVVADVRLFNFDTDTMSEIYRPHAQMPWMAMNLVVRSALEPAALVPLIRREIHKLDPDQPLRRITTMTAAYDRSLARRRLVLGILSVFAAAALAVSAVGIYGVMAWSVSQRTREIGLRMALGARANNVLTMVLAQSGRLFALGLILGLPLTWLLTRAMSGMIFGAAGFDVVTFLVASAVLGVAVFVASFMPAWRASRVSPLEALHYE